VFRGREIGHHEMEMIDGMDPEFPGSPARFDKALNLGHCFLLTLFQRQVHDFLICKAFERIVQCGI
jgi:hypothetical protein